MKEKNKNSFLKNFMLVIITALITCILTTIVVYNAAIAPKTIQSDNVISNIANGIITSLKGKEEQVSLEQKTSDIKKKLEEIYIGDIDEKKMIDGALEGYVAALGDEYTEYLTEEEVISIMEDVNGAYVGVGLYITQNVESNEILVIGVIEDSPANKAGILVGDVVKKVDDTEYTGEQLTQASNKMKGVEGTKVKVTVKRNDKEIDFDITREKIKFKCVKSEKLENNVGYIKISSFDGGCASDFEKAYKELETQGIQSLVIDLRNNGGGLVDESLKIAELIVPKGSKMLITKDKNENEDISVSKKDPIIKMPIAILVNGYTASASEILTAAIRENTDVKVVGTQTYGKGIIQGIFMFNDQKTGMKITMQEYFTPNHNKLHKIGIKPDIELELPEEWKGHLNVDRNADNQLNKALEILK
nr:S41 family peptidase [Clostridia bacterium]